MLYDRGTNWNRVAREGSSDGAAFELRPLQYREISGLSQATQEVQVELARTCVWTAVLIIFLLLEASFSYILTCSPGFCLNPVGHCFSESLIGSSAPQCWLVPAFFLWKVGFHPLSHLYPEDSQTATPSLTSPLSSSSVTRDLGCLMALLVRTMLSRYNRDLKFEQFKNIQLIAFSSNSSKGSISGW